jgi:hypothetical protein
VWPIVNEEVAAPSLLSGAKAEVDMTEFLEFFGANIEDDTLPTGLAFVITWTI